jgi:plastocyanin
MCKSAEGKGFWMRRSFVVAGLVATAAAVAVSQAGAASMGKLTGTVGPGFTITLTEGGKKVTKLKAGTYTFVIDDKSTMHSYALDGPKGFAKDFTSVPFKGSKTFTVALKKGSYKYYCAAHEAEMFGHFTVS